MFEPRVRIRFDGNGCAYRPGETLSGDFRLESIRPDDVQAIEVSVLWLTEGKGDEDLAVHHFERTVFEDAPVEGDSAAAGPTAPAAAGTNDGAARSTAAPAILRRPIRFSTVLPNSPLSYRGVIVKIHWCVRVRVFMTRGKPIVVQREFQLGCVPAMKAEEQAGEEADATAANGARPNGASSNGRALRAPRTNGTNGTNGNGTNGSASASKATIV